MIRFVKTWRAKRRALKKDNALLLALYRIEYQKINPPHEAYIVRQLSEDILHGLLARAEQGNIIEARVAIERELRRRDAWASPAGRAFWISIAALVVSIAALGVSILIL